MTTCWPRISNDNDWVSCVHMSVFALSSDNQWGLLDFWSDGDDMLTWGRRNYLGSKTLRYQKCSEIWGRPDLLGSVCYGPRHFLSFVRNCTADHFMS